MLFIQLIIAVLASVRTLSDACLEVLTVHTAWLKKHLAIFEHVCTRKEYIQQRFREHFLVVLIVSLYQLVVQVIFFFLGSSFDHDDWRLLLLVPAAPPGAASGAPGLAAAVLRVQDQQQPGQNMRLVLNKNHVITGGLRRSLEEGSNIADLLGPTRTVQRGSSCLLRLVRGCYL